MRYVTVKEWSAGLSPAASRRVDRLIARSERNKEITVNDLIRQRRKKIIPPHTHNVKVRDTFNSEGTAVHIEYRH